MAAEEQTADVRRGVSSLRRSSQWLSADFSVSKKKLSTKSSRKVKPQKPKGDI